MNDDLIHFEDVQDGWSQMLDAEYLVTREDIIEFASEFDPQPMHLDEAAAENTMLAGLAASGWHTCSIGMRLMSDGYIARAAGMGSPGLEETRWLTPVRPGMRLKMRVTCKQSRRSKSRPDMGICLMIWEILDEKGTLVCDMTGYQLFKRRHPGAA